jgi:hypothetical protein
VAAGVVVAGAVGGAVGGGVVVAGVVPGAVVGTAVVGAGVAGDGDGEDGVTVGDDGTDAVGRGRGRRDRLTSATLVAGPNRAAAAAARGWCPTVWADAMPPAPRAAITAAESTR